MPRPHTPSDEHLAVVQKLSEAWHTFQSYAAVEIREHGVSAPQFLVLSALQDVAGLTFTELGEHTAIYKTTLTGVVDRLAHKNLVTRRPCERDRRCVYVCLTEDGHELLARVAPAHAAHLRARLQRLDSAELREARRLLERLRDVFGDAAQ